MDTGRRFFIHPSGRSSFAETAAGLPEEGSKDAPPNGPLASRPGTEEEFTLGHVFPAEKKKYIVTDPTKLSANGKFLYQDVESGEFLEVPDGARVIVQVPKNGGEDVNDGGTDKTAADPAGSIYQTGDHEALGPASVLAQGPAPGGAVSSLDAESGALPGVVPPPNGPGAAVAPGGPEVPASHNPYAAPPTGAGGGGGMEVAANAKDPELVEAEDVEEGNGGNVAQGEAAPALPGQETAATGAQEDPGVGVAQQGAPAGAAGAAGSDGSATTPGDQQGHNPEATSLLAIGQPTRFISGGRGKNVDEVPLTMNHIAPPGAFEVADDSFNRAKLAEIDAAVAVEIQHNDPTFSADAPSSGLGSKVVPMRHVVFLEVDHRGATPSSSRRALGRSRRRRAPFTVFENSEKWVELTASSQVAQKVAEEVLTKGKTRESGLAEANEQRRRSCEDGAPFVYMPLLKIPFGYSRRGFRDGHYFDIDRNRINGSGGGDGYGCPAPKQKQIVPAWVMNEVAQDFFVDPY
eukprot:g17374.t1